jgi:hypothetical protein
MANHVRVCRLGGQFESIDIEACKVYPIGSYGMVLPGGGARFDIGALFVVQAIGQA